MAYELILTETRGRVGYITLNRPEALNALNGAMSREIIEASKAYDADPEIGAIVITGSAKAFAKNRSTAGGRSGRRSLAGTIRKVQIAMN